MKNTIIMVRYCSLPRQNLHWENKSASTYSILRHSPRNIPAKWDLDDLDQSTKFIYSQTNKYDLFAFDYM